MIQKTCILIKPDGYEKKLVGKVISQLEQAGFQLQALRLLPPVKERLESFYAEHVGKHFFNSFLEFMLSGPVVATVWEGENIIERSRKLIGATDSPKAEPGTLRNLYGTDSRKNLVHGSDSVDSARREIRLLFQESDIYTTGSPSPIAH